LDLKKNVNMVNFHERKTVVSNKLADPSGLGGLKFEKITNGGKTSVGKKKSVPSHSQSGMKKQLVLDGNGSSFTMVGHPVWNCLQMLETGPGAAQRCPPISVVCAGHGLRPGRGWVGGNGEGDRMGV